MALGLPHNSGNNYNKKNSGIVQNTLWFGFNRIRIRLEYDIYTWYNHIGSNDSDSWGDGM